jgi:hypothetical protein
MDGIVSACKFIKEYILYNTSKKRNIFDEGRLQEFRGNIIEQCSRLYTLGTIDRYMFYGIVYLNYLTWDCIVGAMYNTQTSLDILYAVHYILSLPYIQNKLLKIQCINRIVAQVIDNRRIFTRYSLSKVLINYLQKLDGGISRIKNYQILMLYHHLSLKYAYDFAKAYCFIHLLHYLRQFEATYYYYKAIKLAYYYNSGYLFNVISRADALYIINIIIKEKRWKDIVKVEVMNALHILISERVDIVQDTTQWLWCFLQFYTVWSIICLLKLLNVYLNTIILIMYLSNGSVYKNIKKILIAIVTYGMILLNTNDLIITVVVFGKDFLYIFVDELIFFIKNEKDIKKVLAQFKKRK